MLFSIPVPERMTGAQVSHELRDSICSVSSVKCGGAECRSRNSNPFFLSEELFDLPSSIVKKKVHFSGESKENVMRGENSESQLPSKSKCKDLKKRLHAAQLRAQALSDIEKTYQLKSKQILGMR